MRTFHGTLPALVTPFTRDNRVNVTSLRKLVEHLLAKHIDGLYLCGSTGEGAFMSVAERQLVLDTVMPLVHGRVPVIVHVGAAAIGDAILLAQHARANGAAGISSILPPVIYEPQGVVAYYETLAGAVPDMPFFPYLFGDTRDAVSLMRDLLHIPNLAGTKYFGANMYEMNQIIAMRSNDWTVFSGMDEQCLFATMFCAHGTIGSTLNLMPGVYRIIRHCVETGDFARGLDLQKRANRVIDILVAHGFAGALKAALDFLGFECGDPRVPNLPLPDSKRDDLRAALESVGFFELAAM